jgi:hypothetical protein
MAYERPVQKSGPLADAPLQEQPEAILRIEESLEPQHFGQYVMIDPETRGYVVASTISNVHAKFIDKFGADTAGYCLRIGASAFASA